VAQLQKKIVMVYVEEILGQVIVVVFPLITQVMIVMIVQVLQMVML
jgi:hypothetical protein